MSRVAKLAGGVAFAVTLLSVGTIAWGMLSIRSPLANGGVAAGPEPVAYVVVGVAVLVGAAIAGGSGALVAEAVVRMWRWRRSS